MARDVIKKALADRHATRLSLLSCLLRSPVRREGGSYLGADNSTS